MNLGFQRHGKNLLNLTINSINLCRSFSQLQYAQEEERRYCHGNFVRFPDHASKGSWPHFPSLPTPVRNTRLWSRTTFAMSTSRLTSYTWYSSRTDNRTFFRISTPFTSSLKLFLAFAKLLTKEKSSAMLTSY